MTSPDQRIRLQKFLSEQGLCSRRQAEAWIISGDVSVNGSVAKVGTKIDPAADRVAVDGKTVRPKKIENCTILMNKPRGYICTNRDPHHAQTVFDLLTPTDRRKRLFCAGRLDRDSEGLVILTNDGGLAHRLTHPGGKVVKRYRVLLNQRLHRRHATAMCRGKIVDGENLKAEKILFPKSGGGESNQIEIHLHHGKKREIRRLLETYGYRVTSLRRFQIGALVLRRLRPGHYRRLDEEEMRLLFA